MNVPLEQLSSILLNATWPSANQDPSISNEGFDQPYNDGIDKIAPNQSAAQVPIDAATSDIHHSAGTAQERAQDLIGLNKIPDYQKPAWNNLGLPEEPLWLDRDLFGGTCSLDQAVDTSESNTIPSLLDPAVNNEYGTFQEHNFDPAISPLLQTASQNTDIPLRNISDNHTLAQPWNPMFQDLQNINYPSDDGTGQSLGYQHVNDLGPQQSALSSKTSDQSPSSWAHLISPSTSGGSAVVAYRPPQSDLPKWLENQESMWEAVMSGPCSHIWSELPRVSDTCAPNANTDSRRLSTIPHMVEVQQTEKNVDFPRQITKQTHQGGLLTWPIGLRRHGQGI